MTAELLSAQRSDALRVIASRVTDLADADVVTVVLPVPDASDMRVEVAVGREAERLTGRVYPIAGTVTEGILLTGQPVVVEDVVELHRTEGVVLHQSELVPVGPVMGLPLAGARGVRGVLMVGRVQGRRPFGAADVEMATTFAHHASVALEMADARRDSQRMELLEDRARIARDLHDHVIQQLFAAGMSLHSAAATVTDARAVERIHQVVGTLDSAIAEIRNSIFQLRPESAVGSGLRQAVVEVAAELGDTLSIEPLIRFSGPVDSVSDATLVHDVSAVVRESVSNAARHARATHVVVTVEASGPTLSVTVADDGRGLGPAQRRSGLANLRERAEGRGGHLEVRSSTARDKTPTGTVVTWTVPVVAPGRAPREDNPDR